MSFGNPALPGARLIMVLLLPKVMSLGFQSWGHLILLLGLVVFLPVLGPLTSLNCKP